jgi:methylmalonyl-CoA/ethylmalonyl-CoA epimerase
MNQAELSTRLWNFAARVGKAVDALPHSRLGRHVAGQLVRSGTSAPPNYDESGAAESRADFVHKLSVALKELRETRGWLRFIVKADLLSGAEMTGLVDEAEQLCRILGKSVLTARRRAGQSREDARFEMPDARFQDSPYQGLDHLAVAVPDTEEALKVWRDTFGFPVLYSEDVNGGTVRLTHLDLGNTQLQLVQPLAPEHPLQAWLAKHGPGLHHFCFKVEDVGEAIEVSPVPTAPKPHQGTQGKRAVFLDQTATQGVQVELTGK